MWRFGYVTVLGLWAMSAHAQPEAAPHAPTPTEVPTEVVVVGQRFPAYAGDAVFSRIDITADQIDQSASLDQALKQASQAALFRRSSSLTANPTVQGMSLRAIAPSGAGRTLITLDGIPQNDPFGGWVIWAGLPTNALAGAHIVRGAGGGAYGAGALTGVIDVSLVPPQALRPYAEVSVSDSDSRSVATGFALGNIAVHLSDQTLHGDVPVRGTQRGAADVKTYGRDKAILLNGQWALAGGELALLAGGYDSVRNTGLKGATARSTGDQVGLSWTRQPTADANGYRLQIWHKDSDLANRSVSVLAGRTGTLLANDQVKTPASGDGINAAIRHRTPSVEWEVGIDARTGDGESREFYRYVSAVATRYRVSGGGNSLIGTYAEGTRFMGPWTLTGAVRLDQWKTFDAHRFEQDLGTGNAVLDLDLPGRSQTLVSGRFGAAYKAWRVAVYTGFRPPSLNELYRPFRVGNDVTEANADLKPETLSGAEIGWRASGRRVRFDADLFYNVVTDPIANITLGIGPGTFPLAGFVPAGGAYRQRQNAGRIRAYGLEAQGQYDLTDAISVTATVTVTHARTDGGLHPAQAPDYGASVGVAGRWMKLDWRADVLFEGRSFEDDLNALPLDAYSKINLSADYPLTPRVQVGVRIDNAFDAAVPIQRSNDGTLNYDTGRVVWLRLSYRR
ncbi:TonB-dependent receptor [Asticcacaulis sp. 201]|uniref:TonB-dependent receptor n=1 Tax=Asticcacaulis sp. 201 TaxID=3028787 RepID=UPI002916B5B3|nr:TonB-dependent receptor [Asticcacaulis sp. 201]MDV6332279.1 TonB-dependent receptor [Asticcacaulis sp. 201]